MSITLLRGKFGRFADVKYYDSNFVYALLLFLNSLPYYIWHMHLHNWIFYPFVIYYLIKYKQIVTKQFVSFFVLIIIVSFVLLQEDILGLVLSKLSLVAIFMLASKKKVEIFFKLRDVLFLALLLSCVSYICVFLLNLSLPYDILDPINPDKKYSYRAYPFFVCEDLDLPIRRFCGIYDEAGALGSICAVLLWIDKFDISKFYNKVFFFAGVLSLSFFFMCVVVLFVVFVNTLVVKYKVLKLLLCFSFFSLLLYNITMNMPELSFFVFDRMEISDGDLSGNNRTDASFENEYYKFLDSDDVWFGRGQGSALTKMSDSSTYKMLVYDYGVIWFALFSLFWLINAKECMCSYSILFVYLFILFMMVYQRPNILEPFFFFLFVTAPLIMRNSYGSCK